MGYSLLKSYIDDKKNIADQPMKIEIPIGVHWVDRHTSQLIVTVSDCEYFTDAIIVYMNCEGTSPHLYDTLSITCLELLSWMFERERILKGVLMLKVLYQESNTYVKLGSRNKKDEFVYGTLYILEKVSCTLRPTTFSN